MRILTASKARENLYRLIDEAAESHQPIVIAGKRTSAVLIASDDWQVIQETLFLMAVPSMQDSIRQGMAEALASSVTTLKW